MKFGPVLVEDAAGTVLAHSVSLGAAGRLRKGRTLTAEDVNALRHADVREVIVARLEADDLHEDEAADALAGALVPDPAAQGVTCSTAFTGRVNVLSAGPGVVELDVDAVEAVNRVDPMITIATVPQYQQMRSGGMIATIKVISYAVPRLAVERACSLAQNALRLRAPVLKTASLIISEIPGGAGDKGKQAIADRLSALGIELAPPVVVPHKTADLVDALSAQSSDLCLILTGSATSDINDVAPSAVRQAGGRVDRFGMPVDPGNLLFIGALNARPVIGLPGCARAPALNGADWVLSRVICGIDVRDADISAMAVGGLLKEIPSRPHPRRKANPG